VSKPRQHFPANRLANALTAARPRSIEQSLLQADENLRQIAGPCADHVDGALERLEAAILAWPSNTVEGYLSSIYQTSLRIVGVASTADLTDLDRAAASLCDVVDGLIANNLWDRGPVEVHIRAMRLLRQPKALGAGAASVMEGLSKIRERFAVEGAVSASAGSE